MTTTESGPLTAAGLGPIDGWWRAANYLSVGRIYLLDNPPLTEELRPGPAGAAVEVRPVLEDKRISARAYTREYGEDAPEITEWKWTN